MPLLIAVAPSWGWIVAANALLGVNQGLAWSMTVVMKIDLVGPKRRGLALGLNEAAGYGGVAVAAALSGWLASEFAPRDVLVGGRRRNRARRPAADASLRPGHAATFGSSSAQGDHDREEAAPRLRQAFPEASYRQPALRSCSQAGLVNNLNDALAWGLVPLFLAANGASACRGRSRRRALPRRLGSRSDRRRAVVGSGRPQAADRRRHAAPGRGPGAARRLRRRRRAGRAAAVVLGVGTALVYPTLIAAISDAVSPVARAPTVGVYRFWRDMGYVAGGLLAGFAADAIGYGGAIAIVAALTAASGIWVAVDLPGRGNVRRGEQPRHSPTPLAAPALRGSTRLTGALPSGARRCELLHLRPVRAVARRSVQCGPMEEGGLCGTAVGLVAGPRSQDRGLERSAEREAQLPGLGFTPVHRVEAGGGVLV